ncbi:transcription factor containing protein, TCP family [Hordeum vulgare]|nr:transcription factor containing protein, TCP family [Hordeum vulgare]
MASSGRRPGRPWPPWSRRMSSSVTATRLIRPSRDTTRYLRREAVKSAPVIKKPIRAPVQIISLPGLPVLSRGGNGRAGRPRPGEQLGEGPGLRGGVAGDGDLLVPGGAAADAAVGAREREVGPLAGLRRAAAQGPAALLLVLLAGAGRGLVVGRVEGGGLVDGGGGGVDEPLDGLAGVVEAEAVLQVVELDGRGHREPHPPVADALGRVHLAVPVLAPRRPHAADPRRRRLQQSPCCCRPPWRQRMSASMKATRLIRAGKR